MAEFVARAGAAEIAVCDPGMISGGLLVRQNYVETDIGQPKAQALATRLRQISDELIVTPSEGLIPDDLDRFLAADLIIDATVSLAITIALDVLSDTPGRKAKFAQIATDSASGTLGLLHLTAPDDGITLSGIDEQAGRSVLADPELEAFHPVWQSTHRGDEIIPIRGCSVPTFHGSAADLAAVAANLVNLIGLLLAAGDTDTAGTHLVAAPNAHHIASCPRARRSCSASSDSASASRSAPRGAQRLHPEPDRRPPRERVAASCAATCRPSSTLVPGRRRRARPDLSTAARATPGET